MCKAEKTNALGMFDYSACHTCQLVNSDKCPYAVVRVDWNQEIPDELIAAAETNVGM